ncbi:phosphoribosylamine--glycine ligase [Caminicella sporogenes DSM 14501]|uniref:Phosphoribosylamine--glycine ligase n=1 Tax=Caminicella sporogenes DSM 14501 TaxID=1121266 RepID=A0A1M6RSM3_9FIRM|nr:phosphoribosylamine--glycine ligase [Caminicella sporogenes]RKD23658.1 phosphoribosylamine--glycine ligase [Caminicella sporogenes]SHK35449.1 phosphoribosylamine--glycine ligase [Caminicella sporogenes DSM 14501]
MKILVVGSGGREHTIVWKLSQSPKVSKVFCAPGNAGIAQIADVVNISDTDIDGLLSFAKDKGIDLTVVGPEAPLVNGIVDRFQREGLKIFGPNKDCARLEGSKSFAKNFMIRHNIPTAKYKEYTDVNEAIKDIGIFGFPMVIKADGLAAGKGVVIAKSEKEALNALEMIMKERKFGEAGSRVVIEEFLDGIEASILCFVDGKTIVPMVSAQDYKKAFDDDKGPNTGGMGTYSPSILFDEELEKKIEVDILKPFIKGLRDDGLDYKGIIFIGLMIANKSPKVLEFNVRFGDPETQVVLTRLETDLVEIIESILDGRLDKQEIKWSDKKAVCVVLASKGYPEKYEKGKIINGLKNINDCLVFHAGTKFDGENIVTDGGRVLGVVALGNSIREAREIAYKNINKIDFEGKQYRKDIGKIAL